MSYFKNDHGDYYAVDSSDTNLVKKLTGKCNKGDCEVSGIPKLCVVNKFGECRHSGGKTDVENKSANEAYDLFILYYFKLT